MDVDLYCKDEAGNWYIFNYEAGDSLAQPFGTKIELKSVKLTFSIEQVYEDIEFVVEDRELS